MNYFNKKYKEVSVMITNLSNLEFYNLLKTSANMTTIDIEEGRKEILYIVEFFIARVNIECSTVIL